MLLLMYFDLLFQFGTVLKESRNDETAFHCKVVCLIQLSQFQQAIKEIANHPPLARYCNCTFIVFLQEINKKIISSVYINV